MITYAIWFSHCIYAHSIVTQAQSRLLWMSMDSIDQIGNHMWSNTFCQTGGSCPLVEGRGNSTSLQFRTWHYCFCWRFPHRHAVQRLWMSIAQRTSNTWCARIWTRRPHISSRPHKMARATATHTMESLLPQHRQRHMHILVITKKHTGA